MQISLSANMAIVTIQDSFEDVINDVESKVVASESIWVARRFSVDEDHQELYLVIVALDPDGKVSFTCPDVEVARRGIHKYTIAIKGESYELWAPKRKISAANEDVTAVATISGGDSLVVGNSSGAIVRYDTSTQEKLLEIKEAHYAGIHKLVVFPSNTALLSVGRDFQTKLWSLEDAQSTAVRSFLDQKKEITDVALIGKGRNFMTSSLDGSVNLWECSTGSVISRFVRIDNRENPATCLAVATGESEVSPQDSVGGDLLFECSDKVVYVGYQSGLIQQFSVAGHYQTAIKFKRDSEVSSLGVFGDYVVAGYGDGQVFVWNHGGDTQFTLELNENYPVSNLLVESWDGKTAVFIVTNGPDLLLRVAFDVGGSFSYKYLVGLSELFRVELVASTAQGVVAATQDEIVEY